MDLNTVTALVLTRNEAPNLSRTLSKLGAMREVVIVDSGSTDGTQDVARSFPNVRVVERRFTTHAEQWNFGLTETGIATEWVLALDADFVLTDECVQELRALVPGDAAGFEASFRYCIDGRPLRAAVYPPVTVLYRRAEARYEQDGHTQRVKLAGRVRPLTHRILHDDRKPLGEWLRSQARYMALEADKLAATPAASLTAIDRLRSWVVIAPPAMFWYCLVIKGGIRDGWRGVFYAIQRTVAEAILSLTLIERRWRAARR